MDNTHIAYGPLAVACVSFGVAPCGGPVGLRPLAAKAAVARRPWLVVSVSVWVLLGCLVPRRWELVAVSQS